MVFEALHQFLEKRAGLKPSQIPAVLSTFAAVKWATSGAFILAGVKFRPLKRVFGEGGEWGGHSLGSIGDDLYLANTHLHPRKTIE
jgi:hypothetical protein